MRAVSLSTTGEVESRELEVVVGVVDVAAGLRSSTTPLSSVTGGFRTGTFSSNFRFSALFDIWKSVDFSTRQVVAALQSSSRNRNVRFQRDLPQTDKSGFYELTSIFGYCGYEKED